MFSGRTISGRTPKALAAIVCCQSRPFPIEQESGTSSSPSSALWDSFGPHLNLGKAKEENASCFWLYQRTIHRLIIPADLTGNQQRILLRRLRMPCGGVLSPGASSKRQLCSLFNYGKKGERHRREGQNGRCEIYKQRRRQCEVGVGTDTRIKKRVIPSSLPPFPSHLTLGT